MDPQTQQGTGQQGAGQTAQTPAPAQTAPATTPAQTPAVTSQGAGQAAGVQQTAAPAAVGSSGNATGDGYVSVRDALAGYGLDLRTQFQDDHQTLQHLVLMARQAQEQQQLVQYGQQYLQHAPQFQQWLTEQQRQQQALQQQQQSWWNAPQYDPSWVSKIVRDPQTGELRALPGSPPDLIPKYLAWVDHQRGFLDRFSQDPIAAIKPGIEQLVQEQAARIVQQHLGQYQEQVQTQQILAQNAEWLYVKDKTGQVARDERTGRPILTDLGRAYAHYVQEAEQLGLMDVQRQQRYAMGMVQRDYLFSRMQQQAQQQGQQPAVDPAQAVKQQFLNQAAGQAAQQPVPPPGNTNGNYHAPNGVSQRGLQELMMQEFRQAGILPGQSLVG